MDVYTYSWPNSESDLANFCVLWTGSLAYSEKDQFMNADAKSNRSWNLTYLSLNRPTNFEPMSIPRGRLSTCRDMDCRWYATGGGILA